MRTRAETTLVLRPVRPLPPKLQTLLDVHARVTSLRWRRRRAAPDGTWFSEAPGWIYRLRTEQQIPAPGCCCPGLPRTAPHRHTLERTTR